MANKTYKKIYLYADSEKYQQLKDLLEGNPVSVWFRKMLDDYIEYKTKKEVKG